VRDLFKKTSGLLCDKTFITSLSVSWLALALVHYFPTEVAFIDRLPSFTPILILLSMATGFRLPNEHSKAAWFGAFVAMCSLFLSCGYDLGVYPLLRRDFFSLSMAGTVALAAVLSTSFSFFKLGQALSFHLLNSGRQEFLRTLSFGSISGIVIFLILMATTPTPASLVLLLLFIPNKPRLPIIVAAIMIAIACQSTTSKFVFSHDKKFEVKETTSREIIIATNGLPSNFCVDIPGPERLRQFAQMEHVQPEIDTFRHYLGRLAMPLGFSRQQLDHVLILGANTGNDVSFALKNGAGNIDAVELDGTLVKLAANKHPDKPYQNAKVATYITDPRYFLQQTKQKYDLIEFCYFNPGRCDSAAGAIRADSFIHTTECFNLALKCLKPDGVLFVGFSAPARSLAPARLHASIQATGERAQVAYLQHNSDPDPLATKYYFFALGPGVKSLSRSDLDPLVTQFIHITPFENVPTDEKGASDNWPFLRANDRDEPTTWVFATAVILLSATLQFIPKSQKQQFYLAPLLLGIVLALANYLSFASICLIAGFHWVAPVLVLLLNFAVWAGFGEPATRSSSAWVSYILGALACGIISGLSGQPIAVCTGSILLILMVTVILHGTFHRSHSPAAVVYYTLSGIACGCVSTEVAIYFGLSSLAIIALVSLVLSYLIEKNS